jgi:NAD(P)-dependent dehydrogenase (short-subunit alcohol dehydrogenase family)
VLVTGGSRGIGRAIALRFARAGARICIAARRSAELDKVAAEIEQLGGKGLPASTDVTDHGSVEACVYRAVEFLGDAIDVLVNNAGGFDVKPLEKMDVGTWQRLVDVNLNGPFYVALEAREALLAGNRPHLFNVASISAKSAFAGQVAYTSSKWGLRGLSEALRAELGPKGVRVSTVYPGATDTSIFDGVPGNWDRSRMNKPEDVAEVVWSAYHAADGAPIDDLDVPPRG